MDTKTKNIYDTIFQNSILFLRRGISEIIKNNSSKAEHDQAVISCLFTQMSIELSLKAYLIKEDGIKSILNDKFQNKSIDQISNSFNNNQLHTRKFEDLKNYIKSTEELNIFNDTQYGHIKKLQTYRNRLMHLNLKLSNVELDNIFTELIYVNVHIILPLLTKLSFEFDTPGEFYEKYLDLDEYKKMASFQPYLEQMEQTAKEFGGANYECLICYNRTFSPFNDRCYSCNLDFSMATDYTDCISCESKRSVMFDPLNIVQNGNTINALCLNCGDKPDVFKCPNCEEKVAFYGTDELSDTCYNKCLES
ncbi:MAG: hypothetical protein HRT58_10940 [Crocinitomicaceae bacterium]|nr:hypothetical protein [Flavobacteriales bacterium]NQZ36171.1 hypothetical protein [Crocinitomicaceae bacterium]